MANPPDTSREAVEKYLNDLEDYAADHEEANWSHVHRLRNMVRALLDEREALRNALTTAYADLTGDAPGYVSTPRLPLLLREIEAALKSPPRNPLSS